MDFILRGATLKVERERKEAVPYEKEINRRRNRRCNMLHRIIYHFRQFSYQHGNEKRSKKEEYKETHKSPHKWKYNLPETIQSPDEEGSVEILPDIDKLLSLL